LTQIGVGIVLNLQVFALTLMPLLSGSLPGQSAQSDALALLGAQPAISAQFMVGYWKSSDHFYRWGITDKRKATVRKFSGAALMAIEPDGKMQMIHLFQPSSGRWEMAGDGIRFYDPNHPERGAQTFGVRKRDENRIWMLLPFSGGASGIGMVRINREEYMRLAAKLSAGGKARLRRRR
jgi:hypothetical protein